MTLVPTGTEVEADSTPLEIDETKKAEMTSKAKELLTEPMESKQLQDALEQHYVALHEHYTSAQLKEVVDQVEADLAETNSTE